MTGPDPDTLKWFKRFYLGVIACAIASFTLFLSPLPNNMLGALGLGGLIVLAACGVTLIITEKKEGFFEKFQQPLINFIFIFLIIGTSVWARSLGIVGGTILMALLWGIPLAVLSIGIVNGGSRARRTGPPLP